MMLIYLKLFDGVVMAFLLNCCLNFFMTRKWSRLLVH